jgi:hypothetical protein
MQKKSKRPAKDRRRKAKHTAAIRDAGERINQLKAELAAKDLMLEELREKAHPLSGALNATTQWHPCDGIQPDIMGATVAFDYVRVKHLIDSYGTAGAADAATKFTEYITPLVKDLIYARLMNHFCPASLTEYRLGQKSPLEAAVAFTLRGVRASAGTGGTSGGNVAASNPIYISPTGATLVINSGTISPTGQFSIRATNTTSVQPLQWVQVGKGWGDLIAEADAKQKEPDGTP